MRLVNRADILNAIHLAGVVGAGGAGFPTHVKFEAKVDTIIANGSECEPLLGTDKSLMKRSPELVVEGLKIAMKATGAKKGVIAVKSHYKDVIASLKKALPEKENISLHLLENYYPAGDEFLLVYDVTKRAIPEGGLPLHVGVVVSNVLTLAQVASAIDGKPVTERPVTVTGAVARPQVLTVPIGTTYRELLKFAGGTHLDRYTLIDGGPMMGKIVEDIETGIGKTTSALLVLPSTHIIVEGLNRSLSQMVKRSKSACCQCFRCTDLCPRNLLGHDIHPHMTMRTIDYNLSNPTAHITSAFLCSQCGMCELVACDIMQLSPRKIFAEYKKLLTQKGIKNPHRKDNISPNEQYENRKISIQTLLKKCGLTEWSDITLSDEGSRKVSLVRVPLDRHVGAPAVATIGLGKKVKMTDVIAASPKGSLGTFYHAPISGTVTDIRDNWIEIRKE
jgi:Na+-translocating ferredoxin:NAD+ oxidoreductase RnfC subunit